MKNLKNFKLLVLTAILGVAFSACNKENGLGTDQQEPEYITVNLGVAGEYLEISESPLTRAAGSDLIAISVSEIEFYPGEGGHYMEKGNYAFG